MTPAIVCRPAMVRGLTRLLTGGITVLLIPFGSPPVLRACLHIHQTGCGGGGGVTMSVH